MRDAIDKFSVAKRPDCRNIIFHHSTRHLPQDPPNDAPPPSFRRRPMGRLGACDVPVNAQSI